MRHLALVLLRGLGRGIFAAGGGNAASGSATSMLAVFGGKRGKGCGEMTGRRGVHRCGSQRKELNSAIEQPLEATVLDVRPENRSILAMTDADENALRCLAAHVTSFTDGRVRVRHPALCTVSDLEALRRQLLARPGMREVTFNPVTGSALLRYDSEKLDRMEALTSALPLGVYLVRSALPA